MNSSAVKSRPDSNLTPNVSTNWSSAMYTVAFSVGRFWSCLMFTPLFQDEFTNGI